MHFRIADTFQSSLARLTGDEQKAVKITVFDLQANPASPGMSFHKLDKAKDKNFWSVRINAEHLPSEAAEALLELATGGKPKLAPAPTGDPFSHTDAQRRFRIMANAEELGRAMEAPWEKWLVFLHPDQQQWVEREYSGPARVAGSAGTGKTVVALHRAVHMARANPDSRVLLTTFSDTLANALRAKFRHLVWNQPRLGERIDIHAFNAIALRLSKGGILFPSHKITRYHR